MSRWHLSIFLVISLGLSECAQGGVSPGFPSSSLEWVQRPWEIRYILFSDGLGIAPGRTIRAAQHNIEARKPDSNHAYFLADEFFKPANEIVIPGADTISVFLVAFDKNGRLKSSNKLLNQMTAKINAMGDLVAVNLQQGTAKAYYLADWSQGIPGDTYFSPAVCRLWDADRYRDDWDQNSDFGSFGCREWTAQLRNADLPYIDVTSYSPHGDFIGDFVGWSRFSDRPKPIIGKQGSTWLCLHDCPVGEKPGIIANIKAWAAMHHFQLPRRPQRQPAFPNSQYKDDLKEEFED